MAKRSSDEDEEDIKPERKRRRPKKKPEDDTDDDAPGQKGKAKAKEDEDEEENSLSTGNVLLDILLDFRDDCIDWSKEHFPAAICIGVTILLLAVASFALSVRYVINYINRPTLRNAVAAYDLGSYPEAKRICDTVLKYTPEDDYITRAGLYFVLGASTVSIAEIAWDTQRQPYYLAAAKYLSDSAQYGFLPNRQTEGFFLLGKSLYLSDELIRCRSPLERALELGSPNTKQIHWFLANSYFLDAVPDYLKALNELRNFRRSSVITEDEKYEADILNALILLQQGNIEEAEKVMTQVPLFDKYQTMQHFIKGQIALLSARNYRSQTDELANNPNPIALNPADESTGGIHSVIENLRTKAAEHYQQAINDFQEVRHREVSVPLWRRQAELLEGLSLQESGQWEDAQKNYLRIAETYPESVEAASANFLWAELERQAGRNDSSLRGYSKAFEILRNTKDKSCPWFSRETMIQRCEEMVRDDIPLREYQDGLTLLRFSRGVMPSRNSARLRGETYEDWAQNLAQQAAVTLGDEGMNLRKEANDKYNGAALAFDELARIAQDEPEYDQYLRRSAEDYRLAHNYRKAIPQYQTYLKVNRQDYRPEIDYYVGEMYLHLDGIDQTISVTENALEEFPLHPLVPRMRILLSRAYGEKGETKTAEDLLRQNLIGEYTPSSAVYRDSMFALAKMMYEQKNLSDAIPFLEDAVKNYPSAIQTPEALYLLGQSYLSQADETERSADQTPLAEVKQQIQDRAVSERFKALEQIQQAESQLTQRQNAVGLTEAEQLMLRNTLFSAGSLMMKLKQYRQAIPTLNAAATRYRNQPEALDALMYLSLAFRETGQPDEAFAALNQASFLLSQLERAGNAPTGRDWKSLIDVQKNLLRNSP